jgi:predicted ATP-dependent endonuclease of OLD family
LAYIVQFQIDGLAGREKPLQKRLHRDVNVFFGHNGSGKTSLLRILDAAMSNQTSELSDICFDRAEVVIYSDHLKSQVTHVFDKKPKRKRSKKYSMYRDLRPHYSESNLFEMVTAEQGWDITPELPKEFEGSWHHEFLSIHRLYDAILGRAGQKTMATDPITSRNHDSAFEKMLAQYWTTYFAKIQNSIRTRQQEGFAEILMAMIKRSKPSAKRSSAQIDTAKAFGKLQEFFGESTPFRFVNQVEFREALKGSENLQVIVKVIEKLEEDVKLIATPKTRLQEFLDRIISGGKRIIVSDSSIDVLTKKDEAIGVRSLSSGEKHILRLLVSVLRAERSSFLIDEPEMSLHINWQNSLIGMMRELNSSCQIIAATHSPEVVANVPDQNIFRMQ